MEEERDISVVPAPWTLTGVSYVLLAWFPREFVLKKGFVPESMKDSFLGGPGWVMYVDYSSSNAGPYQELLFIPGRFDFSGRSFFSITKIYVSTMESVAGGKANWAIPKELASFERTSGDGKGERVRVSRKGEIFADLLFRSYPLRFPVTTSLMPSSWRTVAQNRDGETLLTTLRGYGAAAPARLVESRINPELFPPITEGRFLWGVKMPRFVIEFPQAETA
ncbi:MAG TPA: acetoacetate decarboxylase family protein [Deltaproteobacteria bacterium]|nr:acetoacetate decarboxylase family protein [Deltaproteobacteria bacterium]